MASQSKPTRPIAMPREGYAPICTTVETPLQNIRRSVPALRIIVADDHYFVLQGLLTILRNGGFVVVGEAMNGQEAIQQAMDRKPDVAILDLAMPGINGIEAARQIRRTVPCTKIILLTIHNEFPYILEALRARIHGYVLKSSAAEDLLRAIWDVYDEHFFLSSDVSRALVKAYLGKEIQGIEDLSSEEVEGLRLVEQGKTSKEMGAILGITRKTVATYRKNLMHKLIVRCGGERVY